jgi:hypothetical protein
MDWYWAVVMSILTLAVLLFIYFYKNRKDGEQDTDEECYLVFSTEDTED